MRRRDAQRGYTLLEVLAVVAIAIGLVAVAGVGVRRLRQSDLRTAASQLAGTVKFTYDRAVTGGRYYRLVIDLDQKTFWPESSDDRFYLVRGRAQPTTEDDRDDDDGQKPAPKSGGGGGSILGLLGGAGAPPATVAAKVGVGKARFAPDTAGPSRKGRSAPLRDVTIDAVWTARADEPVTQGRAHLYFYPEGRTERAIIHLSDTSDNHFSLVIHPLTGRVQIHNTRVELPRSSATDDAGEEQP